MRVVTGNLSNRQLILFFLHTLGTDPFDRDACNEKIPNREQPETGIEPGSLVQWDAHYGPNEGGMPLERLMDNDNFKVVRVFKPVYPFIVLGGYEYEVVLFARTGKDQP